MDPRCPMRNLGIGPFIPVFVVQVMLLLKFIVIQVLDTFKGLLALREKCLFEINFNIFSPFSYFGGRRISMSDSLFAFRLKKRGAI